MKFTCKELQLLFADTDIQCVSIYQPSFMVLASNSVGLVIDIWKISKAISIKFEGGKIEWVEAKSYKKSKTKEYDEIATSHLLFVTMPLVAG